MGLHTTTVLLFQEHVLKQEVIVRFVWWLQGSGILFH